ncbi:MAG: hypothetical protein FWD68_11565 [Alphaproteobacteria bacterium]|nr:hypothetical protein [Alphaproteobacteria bacterium]
MSVPRFRFPWRGTIISVLALGILLAAAWTVPVFKTQAWYIKLTAPVSIVAPFYMTYLFHKENFWSESVPVLIGVFATFLGTSLAFIQNSIQTAEADKEQFIRMLKLVEYELVRTSLTINKDTIKNATAPPDLPDLPPSVASLDALLASEKTSLFLSDAQIMALDLNRFLFKIWTNNVSHNTSLTTTWKSDANNYVATVENTYSAVCIFRLSIADDPEITKWLETIHSPFPWWYTDTMPRKCKEMPRSLVFGR